jgi:hypothetical protein
MSDERFDVRSEWSNGCDADAAANGAEIKSSGISDGVYDRNEVVDGELEVTGGALAKRPWSGSRAISAEACLGLA